MQLNKCMPKNGLDTQYLRKMAEEYVSALPRVHQVLAYRYIADGGEENPEAIQDMGFLEYVEYQIKESSDGGQASGDQAVEVSTEGDTETG